jgi:hypothetical protein
LIRKFLSTLLAGASLVSGTNAQREFAVRSASIVPPTGWRPVQSSRDKLIFRSQDNHQQATITVMHFGVNATLEDFRRLCEHRFEAEREAMTDGFIEPDTPAPFKEGDAFGMLYSGGERRSHRAFSGYLVLRQKELITIYVEGIDVPVGQRLQSPKSFVAEAKSR